MKLTDDRQGVDDRGLNVDLDDAAELLEPRQLGLHEVGPLSGRPVVGQHGGGRLGVKLQPVPIPNGCKQTEGVKMLHFVLLQKFKMVWKLKKVEAEEKTK